MGWWPWRRSTDALPLATAAVSGASASPGWADLPPVQRTLARPLAPVAPPDAFRSSLTTSRDPRFLAPLSHQVDRRITGLVDGLADVAPLPLPGDAPAAQLAVLSAGAPGAGGAVQRRLGFAGSAASTPSSSAARLLPDPQLVEAAVPVEPPPHADGQVRQDPEAPVLQRRLAVVDERPTRHGLLPPLAPLRLPVIPEPAQSPPAPSGPASDPTSPVIQRLPGGPAAEAVADPPLSGFAAAISALTEIPAATRQPGGTPTEDLPVQSPLPVPSQREPARLPAVPMTPTGTPAPVGAATQLPMLQRASTEVGGRVAHPTEPPARPSTAATGPLAAEPVKDQPGEVPGDGDSSLPAELRLTAAEVTGDGSTPVSPPEPAGSRIVDSTTHGFDAGLPNLPVVSRVAERPDAWDRPRLRVDPRTSPASAPTLARLAEAVRPIPDLTGAPALPDARTEPVQHAEFLPLQAPAVVGTPRAVRPGEAATAGRGTVQRVEARPPSRPVSGLPPSRPADAADRPLDGSHWATPEVPVTAAAALPSAPPVADILQRLPVQEAAPVVAGPAAAAHPQGRSMAEPPVVLRRLAGPEAAAPRRNPPATPAATSFVSMFGDASSTGVGADEPSLQREPDAPAAAPEPPDPSPGPPPAAAAPPSVPVGSSAADLEEMARRLYEPLSARLRAELWLDRERAGLMTDAH